MAIVKYIHAGTGQARSYDDSTPAGKAAIMQLEASPDFHRMQPGEVAGNMAAGSAQPNNSLIAAQARNNAPSSRNAFAAQSTGVASPVDRGKPAPSIARTAADVAPYVGGMAGGVLGGESPMTAAAFSHVGGDAGEMARIMAYRAMGLPTPQGADAVNDIVSSGNMQALNELTGRAFAGGSRWVGQKFLNAGVRPSAALKASFPNTDFGALAEANPTINTARDANMARKAAKAATAASLDAEAPKLVMPAQPAKSAPAFTIPAKAAVKSPGSLGTPGIVVQPGSAPGPAFHIAGTPDVPYSAPAGSLEERLGYVDPHTILGKPDVAGPMTPGSPRVVVGGTPPIPAHVVTPARPQLFGPAKQVSPATPAVYSGTPISAKDLVSQVRGLLSELGESSLHREQDLGQVNDNLEQFLTENEGRVMSPSTVDKMRRAGQNAGKTPIQQASQGVDVNAVSPNRDLTDKAISEGASRYLKSNVNGYARGMQQQQDAIALMRALRAREAGGGLWDKLIPASTATIGGALGHGNPMSMFEGALGGAGLGAALMNPTVQMTVGHGMTNPTLLGGLSHGIPQVGRLGEYFWQHRNGQ